jgi:4-amino-4-deoxy-L-arabinose transferase-like glycosyltransferase
VPDSRRQALFVFAAAAVLLLPGLGGIDLWTPDEPRYGQVAEELRSMEHGLRGLVLLHLGGEPYTQKPPLYYWLAALAGAPGGRVTEAAARIPSALAGIAAVLCTFALARRLFRSPRVALFSSLLLLTTFRFAHLGRRAQLDVLLTSFEALALLAFWRLDRAARDGDPVPHFARTVALLHLALGAAALTKGPVGWIPLGVIAVYLAWERRLGLLRDVAPPWALLLSLGPVLVWISAATWLAPAGFFAEAVVENVFDRFLAASSHVRPISYYLYQLPLDFLPWTLLWPLAIAAGWRQLRACGAPAATGASDSGEARSWRLLVAWVVVPFVLFSLSSGKRGLYLLPSFPALALMTGAALDAWLRTPGRPPRWLNASLGLILALLGVAAGGVAARGGFELAAFPGFHVSADATWAVVGVAALGLLGGNLLTRVARRGAGPVPAAIGVVLALELVAFTIVYPGYDAEKSPRPVAAEVVRLTSPGEPIGIFDDEGLAGGILYYGPRPVRVLRRPPDVARFLDGGGRFVVLERWKLPWLDPVGRFRVHATTRRDRRELAIVSREEGPTTSP